MAKELKEKMWDTLLDDGIATEAELHLVSDINGFSVQTMEDILYARTGLNSFDQLERG